MSVAHVVEHLPEKTQPELPKKKKERKAKIYFILGTPFSVSLGSLGIWEKKEEDSHSHRSVRNWV
jgi:hypothetical protein